MKWLTVLLLIFAAGVGCAAKKPARVEIPGNCIIGGFVNRSKCRPVSDEVMECDGVAVKYACVKVLKSRP